MLNVSSLRRHQIDAAFPLMQSVLPELTLHQWRVYAGSFGRKLSDATAPHGIMVASAPNGVLRGAFVYEVARHGGDGQALVVHHLFVRHLAIPPLGQTLAAEALARAIQSLALERRCHHVIIELPDDAEWEIGYFRKRGYEVTVLESARTLSPVSA